VVDFSIFAPVLGDYGRVLLLLHFPQLDLLPSLRCCENAGVENPSYSKRSSNDGTYLKRTERGNRFVSDEGSFYAAWHCGEGYYCLLL